MPTVTHVPTGTTTYRPAPVWEDKAPDLFSRGNQLEVIRHAAWRRGCDVERVNSRLVLVSRRGDVVGFIDRMTDRTSIFARTATSDKQITKTLLLEAGLNVPVGRVFDADQAVAAWSYGSSLAKPFVIKPLSGSGGTGITVGVTGREQFNQGWTAAAERGKKIIIEPMIVGSDHRIFVIADQVVAVARRWPASVTGDGEHSVAELVAIKNRQRRKIPYVGMGEFKLTSAMRHHLLHQGLSPESVLDKNQRVQLLTVANISAGGDSEDVTDFIHPSFCEIAVRARRAIPGLFHAGIDLLAADISLPADEQDWGICEINANPDTSLHHFPVLGAARDVAGALIEAVLPEARLNRAGPYRGVELRITGKFQGTGYRNWLHRMAHVHAVDGWVRDLEHESLLAVVYGPRAAVEAIIERCRQGPKQSEVMAIERRDLARVVKPGFTILPAAPVSSYPTELPNAACRERVPPRGSTFRGLDFSTPENFIYCVRSIYEQPAHYPPGISSDHALGFEWACHELDVKIVHNSRTDRSFIKDGKVIGRLSRMVSSLTSRNAIAVCVDKEETHKHLSRVGVPVPKSVSFSPDREGFEKAVEYWNDHRGSFDFVVKPSHGRAGEGITVGIAERQHLEEAWDYAVASVAGESHRILIEERLAGCDFRVVVVKGEVVCAVSRVPAYVIGDGARQIESLVIEKNAVRGRHPHHRRHPISLGAHVDKQYRPQNGEVCFLSDKVNIHQGGEAIDVTLYLPDQVKEVALRACSAIPGLGVGGVDLIFASTEVAEPKVIEINTSANFGIHYFPMYGKSWNPARNIIGEMHNSAAVRSADKVKEGAEMSINTA